MKIPLTVIGLALLLATPARATTIVWIDEGALTSVSSGSFIPGLTVGTPWTLEMAFDSAAPATRIAGPPGSVCNSFPIQATTFTLGGFTYTTGSGLIMTNSSPPGGCSPAQTGDIMLQLGGWTQEPGAFDLNSGIMLAAYRDAIHTDGSLPLVPVLSGSNSGLGLYNFLFGPFPVFQDSTFGPRAALVEDPGPVPDPVPEPGALTLLGLGLAYAGRRRLLKRT